uniref:SUEL-type lectin domain-containing protein n=1 Tax=Pundamilia nyererei TaxID=303518 RepID=A0A3B4FE18_9CICH
MCVFTAGCDIRLSQCSCSCFTDNLSCCSPSKRCRSLYLSACLHTVACEGSQANLHCGENTHDGHVIAVHWANYGRRDTTTCSYQRPECEIQNARCINPTSKVADSCNGKRSCIIEASNSVFGDPCPGTYKYLEVAYDCPCKCLEKNKTLNCSSDEGHVIVVLSAEYGRDDSTTCSYKRPPAQLSNTQCSIPTSKVAESCNGRNSCSIKVRNSMFGDPCPGTYKYLEVVYTCESKCLKDPLNDS